MYVLPFPFLFSPSFPPPPRPTSISSSLSVHGVTAFELGLAELLAIVGGGVHLALLRVLLAWDLVSGGMVVVVVEAKAEVRMEVVVVVVVVRLLPSSCCRCL